MDQSADYLLACVWFAQPVDCLPLPAAEKLPDSTPLPATGLVNCQQLSTGQGKAVWVAKISRRSNLVINNSYWPPPQNLVSLKFALQMVVQLLGGSGSGQRSFSFVYIFFLNCIRNRAGTLFNLSLTRVEGCCIFVLLDCFFFFLFFFSPFFETGFLYLALALLELIL